MKRYMVVIAVIALCLFVLQSLAVAQGMGGQGRQQRTPADMAKSLKDSLNLNDDQVKKITAIYEEQTKALTAMREEMQAGGDPQAMRGKMTELQTKYNDQIKKLLTKEQLAKFEEQLKARAARMQQRQRQN